MIAIFLTLYIVQLITIKGWKSKILHFIDFGIVSILAGLSSAVGCCCQRYDLTTWWKNLQVRQVW